MQKEFQNFQKKSRRDCLIKCIIISISAAAFAVGGILLAAKYFDFSVRYCLLGLIALPIAAGITVPFLHTNQKKLARRMDDTLELHEKVQTMLAFEQSTDSMAVIQREDTKAKLSRIPTKQLRFRAPVLYVLLPILTFAVLIGAIAFPSVAETTDPPTPDADDPPNREITDWEWKALDELILYVDQSEADETYMKPLTLQALDALRSLLKQGVSEDNLGVFVNVTVTEVNNAEAEAKKGLEADGLAADVLTRQTDINKEVCTYTVARLYEIFGLLQPDIGDKTDDPNDEDDNSGKEEWNGGGNLSMAANEKLFDADLGYVSYPDVINTYYNSLSQAFREGVLSEEEWEAYMNAYFYYLYGTKNDDREDGQQDQNQN